MRIIFTTNQMIGSVLIRWFTGQPASHIAFVFDEKIVIHSSLFGVDIKWLDTYEKHSKIVESIDVPLRSTSEEQVWKALMGLRDAANYDFGAVLYQGWRRLLSKFGLKYPHKNKWADREKDMCVEVYAIVSKFVNLPKIENLSMLSAWDVYLALKKAGVSGA